MEFKEGRAIFVRRAFDIGYGCHHDAIAIVIEISFSAESGQIEQDTEEQTDPSSIEPSSPQLSASSQQKKQNAPEKNNKEDNPCHYDYARRDRIAKTSPELGGNTLTIRDLVKGFESGHFQIDAYILVIRSQSVRPFEHKDGKSHFTALVIAATEIVKQRSIGLGSLAQDSFVCSSSSAILLGIEQATDLFGG